MARFRGTTFYSLRDLPSSWPSKDSGAEFDQANLARRLSQIRTAEARELSEATRRREAKSDGISQADDGEIDCNGLEPCRCQPVPLNTSAHFEQKATETVLLSVARELIGLVGDLRVGEPWDELRRHRLWTALAAANVVVGAEIGGRIES